MDKLLVRGGQRLHGIIPISGSKNSSLPILAATLLTADQCVIRRVPDLSDTNYMVQILHRLGAEVERASGVVFVKAENIHAVAPYDLVRKMRASICVMGPLAGRLHEARVSLPGGCVIGDRPVDLHLKGLGELGADIKVAGGDIHITAPGGLTGNEINMRGKHGTSVLGTDNVMMAAVLAKGATVIDGAAMEPEVVDLANFLIKMGAKIEGAGTSRMVIEGVKELHGAEYTVIPDRIEAGTFLVAGAISACQEKGLTLRGCDVSHLSAVLEVLERCGCRMETKRIRNNGTDLTIFPALQSCGDSVTTEVYPGFPTDMQAQMCALFAMTSGVSAVTETIYQQRYMHISELKRMGADMTLEGATVIIRGVERLSGAPVMASDLRASAALVLAGLNAEGETSVQRLYHIDRGYEHIDEKLKGVGADMERVRDEG